MLRNRSTKWILKENMLHRCDKMTCDEMTCDELPFVFLEKLELKEWKLLAQIFNINRIVVEGWSFWKNWVWHENYTAIENPFFAIPSFTCHSNIQSTFSESFLQAKLRWWWFWTVAWIRNFLKILYISSSVISEVPVSNVCTACRKSLFC